MKKIIVAIGKISMTYFIIWFLLFLFFGAAANGTTTSGTIIPLLFSHLSLSIAALGMVSSIVFWISSLAKKRSAKKSKVVFEKF